MKKTSFSKFGFACAGVTVRIRTRGEPHTYFLCVCGCVVENNAITWCIVICTAGAAGLLVTGFTVVAWVRSFTQYISFLI